MNDIVSPDLQALAREFRALSASYEANRDLVLMGAYRAGADAQLDRAIAMHEQLTAFLCQNAAERVDIETSFLELAHLLVPEVGR